MRVLALLATLFFAGSVFASPAQASPKAAHGTATALVKHKGKKHKHHKKHAGKAKAAHKHAKKA